MSDVTVGSASFDAAPSIPEEATRVSGRRFLAHFVDGLIYSVVAFVGIIALIAMVGVLGDSTVVMVLYIAGLAAIITVGHVWFLVLLHGKDGRTPGKHAAGIRVVDAAGNPPTRSQLWKRSWPIIIEYFYVIAWAGMMASSHRQRFGDRWADTYVVRDTGER